MNVNEKKRKRKKLLVMETAASCWKDAIPLGNGHKGAMVYGGIEQEKILLNHENLWLKGRTEELPDVHQSLSELRELMGQGEYSRAETLLGSRLTEKGYAPSFSSYLPGFDITLDMDLARPVEEYIRILDMENGEAAVSWTDGEKRIERKTFVSLADNIIVMKVSDRTGRKFSVKIGLSPHSNNETKDEDRTFHSKFHFREKTEDDFLRNNVLFLEGTNVDGTVFGCIVRVVTDGHVEKIDDGRKQGHGTMSDISLSVSEAGEVLLFCDIYVSEKKEEKHKKNVKRLLMFTETYDDLFQRHMTVHKDLFNRMKLDLLSSGGFVSDEDLEILSMLPLEKLVQGIAAEDSCSTYTLGLLQKMFDFGRYLLIASSADGTLPANLQGIWNGDFKPAWYSFIMANENVQMNYWQAFAGNLTETLIPFFTYFEERQRDFEINAKNIFGCRGIVVPADTSPDSGLLKDTQGHIINWTAGAGWIAGMFYEYYLFTNDVKFLTERALPFMKKVSEFYEDFLVRDKDGSCHFIPSVSPENAPEKFNPRHCFDAEINISIDATMDSAVCRELFSNLISASGITGMYRENVDSWKTILTCLPDYQVNEDGALKEWTHPDFPDNYYHRHVSHLYPLFPGREITPGNKLHRACFVALNKRYRTGFGEQTGWSFVHLANAYARLGEGDSALECLRVVMHSYTGKNLFSYITSLRNRDVKKGCPGDNLGTVFQIDANMGFPAAVLEMLVFSRPGEIRLLYGLPDFLRAGEARGIVCRGGIILDVQWNPKKVSFKIISRVKQQVNVYSPSFLRRYSPSDSTEYLSVLLEKGVPFQGEFKLSPEKERSPDAMKTIDETEKK